jgi:hypothetical protein
MAEMRPERSQPMRMRWIVAPRCVVLLKVSGRVSATFTGRPQARAATPAHTASARVLSLAPNPPPM